MERRDFLVKGALLTAGAATLPVWRRCGGTQKLITATASKGSVQNMQNLFQVTQNEMQQILRTALSQGGERADLFFEYRVNSALRMEEELIKDVSRGIAMGMGVRVVKKDQIGYAYTEEVSLERMQAAATTAAHIAKSKGGVNIAAVHQLPKRNLYQLKQLSVDADLESKLRLIERANQSAKQYDSKVSKVQITLSDEMKQIMYLDSEGRYFEDVQPMLLMRCYTVAQDQNKREGVGSASGGRVGLKYFTEEEHTPEKVARDAAQLAVTNLEARDAPSGPQVVVLGAAESGVLLHEAVGHGLEADFNRKNLSNYANRVGEKVASEHCTVVDAGIYPNLRGSLNIDDEGHRPQETVLIEKGILKGYMHDSISAEIMNQAPTGNGRRQSYAYPPIPRMTNTFLRGGQYSPEEIIASIAKGVYVKRFGGGQVDITKGDFTFGVYEAYLIEKGEVTAPLKNVTLIGNGPQVMNNVVMVGNDPRFSRGSWTCGKDGQRVPVSVGMPTTKVSEITVGGTKA